MIKNEAAYWLTMAHLERWGPEKINNLIIKVFYDYKSNWEEFFSQSQESWRTNFQLTENQVNDIIKAKDNLANNSFLAEDLLSQGFEIIPINSTEYSNILKINLKRSSPPVLYIKGNKKIMLENSVAIVGSRDASDISLQFTDNIAKLAAREYKTVVSGFAKGVDKQALDSSINYKGQSIIVLPQGIMTFGSGIKKYYSQLAAGDVLVLSTFHPKLPWSVGLAMARNPIIYGLSREIYVAQSAESGGTWQGVMDGLKKGRIIYVRQPELNEKSANTLLIQAGAKAVDFNGVPLEKICNETVEFTQEFTPIVQTDNFSPDKEAEKIESIFQQKSERTIEERIIFILGEKSLTAGQLADELGSGISTQKVSKILKNMNNIEELATKPKKYKLLKADDQTSLFG